MVKLVDCKTGMMMCNDLGAMSAENAAAVSTS